ncbi:MAG: DNA polymerase/3'-5' exonuclease PolX [Candidatus Sungbacteria bacterium]|uniref:DNA polymerase beta n=1 Tax=Candidatus Sungiibacteriota bacterium TaxID=2750080 RepID=A0A9D6LUA5_9BACT|nr:DNA polymerase/3'-5' exonuclease PolX [Candidatus Sungbacteria bacterium]
MANREVSKILYEIAELLEADDVPFKPRAYMRAYESVNALGEDLSDIYKRGGRKALLEIPGVGQAIADKLEEYLKTGRVREYERMKKKLPADISALREIEGVGPKAIKVLWQKLRIKNVADLEKAARAGKIAKLPRFGQKSEEKILKGIEFLKGSGKRFRLGDMLPYARGLKILLEKRKEVDRVEIAGSARRWKETIGDLDMLVVSKEPKKVMDYVVGLPEVRNVLAHGETKSSVVMQNGIQVDIRVVPEKSFGAALNYFTGSKAHNVHLRQIAIKKGWKLNEYGLFKAKNQIAGRTEEDLYKKLGMDYVEPEMREDLGEIDVAIRHRLPKLVGYGDLKGDLQTQTDWTDGKDSILDMALAAHTRGLEYIAITDHTKTLAMTGGSDEKKLLKQMAEIDKVNKELQSRSVKFKVLKGAEVNILADGRLDIKDEILAKLDCVGAAVHSHFKLSRVEQTKRLIRAMESPHIDVLFHPTGRLIQKREPIDLDIEAIIKAAKRTKTILEINSYPDRLDLKDEHIMKAREAGVLFSIDSDAHAVSHFGLLEYGIAQARRGWCEKKHIINTLPYEKMLKILK